MKAVILVGGFGTRLRPLTLSVPKPLVEFCNKPMILHQIEALKDAGVTQVILAIAYQPEVMMGFLKEFEQKLGISIVCSQEETPMGTAGPLSLLGDMLRPKPGAPDEPFFMLNADVICNYPFKQILSYHQKHGGEATIVVTKVDEPSKYGVVCFEESSGKVERFVEKPKQFVGNKINAGLYLLSSKVLDRVEPRPMSIEKEVFPRIAEEGKLFAHVLEGYWMDVGQPKDYLEGLKLHLEGLRQRDPESLAAGDHIVGNVLVEPSAKVSSKGCLLGPNVCIGRDCVVEDGVRLSNCMIFPGAVVRCNSVVKNGIVGWQSEVGRWSRLENMCVLGEDVKCKDEVYVNGATVLPHKEVKANVNKPMIII